VNDVLEGDLVKATHREIPELSIQGRVQQVTHIGVLLGALYPGFRSWDFEVLERPAPPLKVGWHRVASPQDAAGGSPQFIRARYWDGEGWHQAEDCSPTVYPWVSLGFLGGAE
jgi:hypothetical protein